MVHRVVTWNLAWAGPRSWRTPVISERLRAAAADVAVVTEARVDVVQGLYECVVHPGPHPRSGQPRGSKVVVASDHPIHVVDLVGSPGLPERNFAAVDVDLPGGRLRVIGIVVRYNEKRRFIDALPYALAATVAGPTIVAGDFNQHLLDRRGLNGRLHEALDAAGLTVWTARAWPQLTAERPLVDHIAASADLRASEVRVWPRRCAAGEDREVSDHAGVAAALLRVDDAGA